MKKLSIGSRLTLWYLAIYAVAQFLFGAAMWFALRQELYGIANDTLTAQVDDLTNLLKAQKKKNWNVPKLQEEVSEAYVLEHSGDFLQVYDEGGSWIFRAPSLEQFQMAPVLPGTIKHPSFRNVQIAADHYRFITQKISVNGRSFTVQTGTPITQMLATLSMFERSLLMLAPLLLLAAATGGYWLSHKALSPVDTLTRTARRIGGGNLSERLEQLTTGDELQRLSDTLNQMLERIEHAFLRVTQFTADASHELRTPISLIRTEAEIALRNSHGEEEYREALRNILLESERTTVLIEDMLAMARADSGSENLHLVPVNLKLLADKTTTEWRHLIENRNLRFLQASPSQEILVLADAQALQRLLAILLDNAVKYTPEHGEVELRLESRLDKAMITVRDTGIGIAEEDQKRIFERFYRADKARSHQFGGAGIGLAIADWIAKRHRGSIAVKSCIGAGSSFVVELPLLFAETNDSLEQDQARTTSDDLQRLISAAG
jgi:heavy metal sensor kinase